MVPLPELLGPSIVMIGTLVVINISRSTSLIQSLHYSHPCDPQKTQVLGWAYYILPFGRYLFSIQELLQSGF